MLNKRSLREVLGGLAVAATLLVSGSEAYAQGYTTSFDNLTKNSSLSGQDGWTTNDEDTGATTSTGETIGQSDYVGVVGGYSASTTDYLGSLGGEFQGSTVPGASTVFLDRPFTLGTTTAYAFNVDMAIERSQSPFLNNDGFNWTFRNGNTTVFSIDFVPQTATASTAGAATVYAVRYTVPGLGGGQTTTNNGILSDSLYHLKVSVNVLTNSFSFAVMQGGTSIGASNVSLLTNLGSSVNEVAATWDVAKTNTTDNGGYTAVGSNTLIFNNYAVTVPEPSTWVVTGLGGLALMLVFRRRMRA